MKLPIVRISCGVLATAAIAVSSIVFLKSKSDYDAYEKQYDADVEAVKASFPALPEKVFFDNSFISYTGDSVKSSKSEYKKSYVYSAREAVVKPLSEDQGAEYLKLDDDENALSECISGLNRKGGAITFNIEVDAYGMSDIEISMRTSRFTCFTTCDECGGEDLDCAYEKTYHWLCQDCQKVVADRLSAQRKSPEYIGDLSKIPEEDQVEPTYFGLENITDYIKIHVNKLEVKTENVELDEDPDGFSSLILQKTRLLKGINTITISTGAYNNLANKNSYLYVMPEIRNMTVLTDTQVIKPEIEIPQESESGEEA